MPAQGHPIWGRILIALLTVWDMRHLMEPVTLLHTPPILMVLMAGAEDLDLAGDLAGAEDLAEALDEDLAGEDGGRS